MWTGNLAVLAHIKQYAAIGVTILHHCFVQNVPLAKPAVEHKRSGSTQEICGLKN